MKPEPMIGEEDVARAIHDNVFGEGRYDTSSPQIRNEFRIRARAAISAHLAALERAGWKCVPVEPTEAMLLAGGAQLLSKGEYEPTGCDGALEIWQEMIDAAPPPQNSDEVKP